MNVHRVGKCRRALQIMVTSVALVFVGLGCGQVDPSVPPKQSETPRAPQPAVVDSHAHELWQELMNNASSALSRKSFSEAEQNCAEAWKMASQFGPASPYLTTNLVLLAEIYGTENKPELAEQTFKLAITNREQAAGTNDTSLIMPLEKLADFYYFGQHRYDLATPLCLRILQLVENASPRDDAEVQKRTLALAIVYRLQSQHAKAEPYYQQALNLAGKNADDLPGGLLATADFYHEWGKLDQAEALCQRALTLQEKSAASNTNAEAQMNLARTVYGIAENYRHWNQLEQAEKFYHRSFSIIERTGGPENSDLARPLSGLAATFAAQGKTNQAVSVYQQAFVLAANALEPEDPLVKAILNDYADLMKKMNQPDEAKALHQRYDWQVLISRIQRARKVNALEAAERLANEAWEIATNFGPADLHLGKTELQMAEIYRGQGKVDRAEEAYRKTVASYEKAVGTNSSELILPLECQADFYYTTKVQYDQVTSLYQRILNLVRADSAATPLTVAHWERNLADVYRLQNQNDRAETAYQRALAMVETVTNSVDDQVQCLQALAELYQTTGRGVDAERMAQRALTLREQVNSVDSGPDAQLNVAIGCDLLAEIYLAQHRPDQAEKFYRRSIDIIQKMGGAESPELPLRLMGLATVLQAQKKYEEAETQYKQALTISEAGITPEAPPTILMAELLEKYAALLQDRNKPDEAKALLARASSIRKQNN